MHVHPRLLTVGVGHHDGAVSVPVAAQTTTPPPAQEKIRQAVLPLADCFDPVRLVCSVRSGLRTIAEASQDEPHVQWVHQTVPIGISGVAARIAGIHRAAGTRQHKPPALRIDQGIDVYVVLASRPVLSSIRFPGGFASPSQDAATGIQRNGRPAPIRGTGGLNRSRLLSCSHRSYRAFGRGARPVDGTVAASCSSRSGFQYRSREIRRREPCSSHPR